MSRRRTATMLVATAAALLVTLLACPVPAGAAPPPEPRLVHDALVLADLDPAGLPTSVTYVSRLTARDLPVREIDVPGPTSKLRYLDRTGSPPVAGDAVRVTIGGPGQTSVATQAQFGKPLPVALHAEYRAGSEVLDPAVVGGRDGPLAVTYTVTNTTVAEQKVTYWDARGRPTSETLPVFAPLAGSLVVVLPRSAGLVSAPGAVVGTTSDGRTRLTWNLVLYPPLGDYRQELTLQMSGTDLDPPGLAMEVMPVGRGQDPATGFAADLLDSSVTGNAQLADGLGELDASATSLADAASDLTDGLVSLESGADSLSRQVSGPFTSGAAQLAAGSAQLAAAQAQLSGGVKGAASGAASLAAGLTSLSDALDSIAAGLAKLAATTGLPAAQKAATDLSGAVARLADAVGSASDPPVGNPPPDSMTLVQAVRAAAQGADGLQKASSALATSLEALAPRLGQVAAGATVAATASGSAAALTAALYAQVCGPTPSLTRAQCAVLDQARTASGTARDAAGAAAAGAAAAAVAVTAQGRAATGIATGLGSLATGLGTVEAGLLAVSTGLRSGDPSSPGVYEGLVSLSAGLAESVTAVTSLAAGASKAATASDELTAGAASLSSGLARASTGAATLTASSQALATGATQQYKGTTAVASGVAQLDAGVGQAADGSGQLAEGADTLEQEGTAKVLASVVDGSTKPALAQAYLAAADARADDAAPYGPVPGAVSRVAYVYTLEPPQRDSGRTLAWLGVAVVAFAALAALAVRRLRSAAGAPARSVDAAGDGPDPGADDRPDRGSDRGSDDGPDDAPGDGYWPFSG